MSIETGIGWESFAIDDSGGTAREMDAHMTTFSMTTSRGIQDQTTISKSARATGLLLADHQDQATLLFDDASNESFDVLKTAGSATPASRTVTRTHSGQTLATESHISNVAWTRPQTGEWTAATTLVLADGTVPTWS